MVAAHAMYNNMPLPESITRGLEPVGTASCPQSYATYAVYFNLDARQRVQLQFLLVSLVET